MSSEVDFYFENTPRPSSKAKGSRLAALVVTYSGGFIKDETRANYVLAGFSLLVIIFSCIIYFGEGRVKTKNPYTQIEVDVSKNAVIEASFLKK